MTIAIPGLKTRLSLLGCCQCKVKTLICLSLWKCKISWEQIKSDNILYQARSFPTKHVGDSCVILIIIIIISGQHVRVLSNLCGQVHLPTLRLCSVLWGCFLRAPGMYSNNNNYSVIILISWKETKWFSISKRENLVIKFQGRNVV